MGALAEPSRRALYDHVVAQRDAVSREQAAEAVGLPLHSVKFHLDRLVDGRPARGRVPTAHRSPGTRRRAPGQALPSRPGRGVGLPPRAAVRPRRGGPRRRRRAGGARPGAASTTRSTQRRPRPDGRSPRARPGHVAAGAELRTVAALLARHGYEPSVTDDGTELELGQLPVRPAGPRPHRPRLRHQPRPRDRRRRGPRVPSTSRRASEPHADLCCVRARRAEPG